MICLSPEYSQALIHAQVMTGISFMMPLGVSVDIPDMGYKQCVMQCYIISFSLSLSLSHLPQ